MKNKSGSNFLYYICLVVLVLLLLLPPGLRIFGKNLFVKEEVKKDEIIVLTCDKQNEKISATFYNGEPQKIDYHIRGNYSISVNEENDALNSENTTQKETKKNELIEIIKSQSQIVYDQNNGETTFSMDANNIKGIKDYATIFSSLDNQKRYYNSQAFYCEHATYYY